MNVCVVYSKKSKPSARALVTKLKEITSNSVVIYRGLPTLHMLKHKQMDLIINVGNSSLFSALGSPPIINSPDKIATSANKKKARIIFKAKSIPAPPLWLHVKDIPINMFPVIGRTTYHMKAEGFWYCRNRKEALRAQQQGATHFMRFIRDTREFRAHVFATTLSPTREDYIVAKLSEKINIQKNKIEIIKNHDSGYKFLAPMDRSFNVLATVREAAKQTIYNFGLHYGAVDIMFSKRTKKPYVLEINTVPCLTDEHSNTLEIYARKISTMTQMNMFE